MSSSPFPRSIFRVSIFCALPFSKSVLWDTGGKGGGGEIKYIGNGKKGA